MPWSPEETNEAMPIERIPKWPMKMKSTAKKIAELTILSFPPLAGHMVMQPVAPADGT